MNRLGQNDFLGLRHQRLGWLTQLSWRKCAQINFKATNSPREPSRPQRLLNPLLTIHTANSAYPRGASCPAGEKGGRDVHQRSSGVVGAAHQDAVAPGAPARARRKRLQLRYAEFQAARPGRTEIRQLGRSRGIAGIAGDGAQREQPYYSVW